MYAWIHNKHLSTKCWICWWTICMEVICYHIIKLSCRDWSKKQSYGNVLWTYLHKTIYYSKRFCMKVITAQFPGMTFKSQEGGGGSIFTIWSASMNGSLSTTTSTVSLTKAALSTNLPIRPKLKKIQQWYIKNKEWVMFYHLSSPSLGFYYNKLEIFLLSWST